MKPGLSLMWCYYLWFFMMLLIFNDYINNSLIESEGWYFPLQPVGENIKVRSCSINLAIARSIQQDLSLVWYFPLQPEQSKSVCFLLYGIQYVLFELSSNDIQEWTKLLHCTSLNWRTLSFASFCFQNAPPDRELPLATNPAPSAANQIAPFAKIKFLY
jgi:hypothetical protein